jgi:biopolymer transport protein ExbB
MNIISILLQITPPTIESMQPAGQSGEQSLSLIELTVKGGVVMIPIFILSIIGVYIFFERWYVIKKAANQDLNFMNRIKDYIHEDKIDAASALCQSNVSPVARMIEKGIQRIGRPLSDIQTAIENVGNLEITKLEKGLALLATVAGSAPMLGFLGTVTGMIKAFYNMSNAGSNITIDLLSNGIYEAMVTTVAGLVVGIMAYFGYNYLVTKVQKVIFQLEASSTEFMDILNEPVK